VNGMSDGLFDLDGDCPADVADAPPIARDEQILAIRAGLDA
jgi:hypothetical protein